MLRSQAESVIQAKLNLATLLRACHSKCALNFNSRMEIKLNTGKKTLHFWPLFTTTSIAGAYVAWQLIGLRYTNHDDIYYNLYSWIYSGHYLDFAENGARNVARLQVYVNMPIYLWVTKISDSALFDILNIGTFGVLYSSLIWLLGKIGSARNSLAIATATLPLVPLHYYFTFPQGYPVVVSWGLAFAFVSAGLLVSYLYKPFLWKLITSVLLFTCSLYGSEYNFALHPVLLLVVFWAKREQSLAHHRKTAFPYIIVWVASATAYYVFSLVSRASGAIVDGRVSFGFDFIAWLKTFFVLQEKAFLPSALWRGITLTSASAQGSPEIPALITFSTLWHGTHDGVSIVVVFVLAFLIYGMALHWQRLSIKVILIYSMFFSCLAIIPCFVLAASALYQESVLKGYLQGHLASFYSQLGISGLVFLLLSYLCNTCTKNLLKVAAVALSAIALASFATTTFIYNNVNRQVMSANKQKWDAMRELATFVQSDRPDLSKSIFYAPDFWSTSGVSAIPGDSLLNGENYWSQYSKAVLNAPFRITNSNSGLPEDVIFVKYFSTPSGTPVVILNERVGEYNQRRITLIASRPVNGTVAYQRDGNRIKKMVSDQWICATRCAINWNENVAFQPASVKFVPKNHGSKYLLAQFLTGRYGEYAHPLRGAHENDMLNLRILNWGPQSTIQGVVPGLQPDGGAGVWIQVSGDAALGEMQIVFDDQPAKSTAVSPGLITATISGDYFNTPGKKEIAIRQVTTEKLFPVGVFSIAPK
jgi:hypothetical protein